MNLLDFSGAAVASGAITEATAPDQRAFLASAPANWVQKWLALAVVVVSAIVFLSVTPFVRMPLVKIPAFITSYEAALAIIDLITAILLFGQFATSRSCALLALACGYLFNTLIIIAHALTFPGAFSDAGLLSAGSQTTAWLYVFWHGSFPVFVLAYALLRRAGKMLDPGRGVTSKAIALSVALVGSSVVLLTFLSTVGMDRLPILIQGGDFSLLIATGVSPIIWTLSLVALAALCWQRAPSVLDLWLRVVMFSWLLDVALSAIISSSRFRSRLVCGAELWPDSCELYFDRPFARNQQPS